MRWFTSDNPLWGHLAVAILIVYVVVVAVGGWYFRPGPKQARRLRRWHL